MSNAIMTWTKCPALSQQVDPGDASSSHVPSAVWVLQRAHQRQCTHTMSPVQWHSYQSSGCNKISMKGRKVLRLVTSTTFWVTTHTSPHIMECGRIVFLVSTVSETDNMATKNTIAAYLLHDDTQTPHVGRSRKVAMPCPNPTTYTPTCMCQYFTSGNPKLVDTSSRVFRGCSCCGAADVSEYRASCMNSTTKMTVAKKRQ